jgi:hypothetical protein
MMIEPGEENENLWRGSTWQPISGDDVKKFLS